MSWELNPKEKVHNSNEEDGLRRFLPTLIVDDLEKRKVQSTDPLGWFIHWALPNYTKEKANRRSQIRTNHLRQFTTKSIDEIVQQPTPSTEEDLEQWFNALTPNGVKAAQEEQPKLWMKTEMMPVTSIYLIFFMIDLLMQSILPCQRKQSSSGPSFPL